MRPVEKLRSGTTITLSDGTQHTIRTDYNPYREAKPALEVNLGLACSYCEDAVHVARNLNVEHVHPKGLTQYAALETKWVISCCRVQHAMVLTIRILAMWYMVRFICLI